jgi:ElaB/YqjD/DUF883 family membrane-anchored ribosome-binding protein
MAKDKATELGDLAKDKASGLADLAKEKAGQVRTQAAARAGEVREQVSSAAAPVWDAAPEQVRGAVTKGAASARDQGVPLAIAVGVILIFLLIRRLRSR